MFRAMFVLEGETEILTDKIIKYRKKEMTASGKRRPVKSIPKKGQSSSSGGITADSKVTKPQKASEFDDGDFGDPAVWDHYFQVVCTTCRAEIAVYG